MSNNIYNILGKLNSLWSTEPTNTVEETSEPIYESVEAKGSITEAVRSLESKFADFKKVEEGKKLKDKKQFDDSAKTGDYYVTSKGNKVIKTDTGVKHEKTYAGDDDKDDLDESAKPDYIDLDKDGDKKEPMKKAAKDAKLDEVSYSAKAARAGKDIGKPGKAFAKIAKSAGERYGSKERGEKVAGAVLKKLRADESEEVDESGLQAYLGKKKYGKEGMKALQKAGREGASKEKMALIRAKHDKMDEVAPPGAKAERMVKHIKKGYAKDGKLTDKEKSIAYATAWKAHNKGQVEEGTEFGDTIKNSEAKMTKATIKEGKEAIRNHPIYTTKEAWDHYAQELAEQEAMDEVVLTPETVNVQQELDEIARLAGLPVKTCEACSCNPCKCDETIMDESAINEAATRKDFRMVADLIKANPDRKKAKELAHHHADVFKQQNPRFKRDMFLAACGLEECDMAPATIVVGEADKCPACDCAPCKCDESMMDEGNEFTKARLDAIAAGKDSFTVGGKTYNVSGDTTDEKTQVEENVQVNEDVNINVSATGEEDVVKLIQKLAGMPVIAVQTNTPQVAEEVVEEERDIEWDNTPEELVAPISAAIPSGTDLNRSKQQDPHTANKGANPLGEEVVEESLWKAYEELISDVKA